MQVILTLVGQPAGQLDRSRALYATRFLKPLARTKTMMPSSPTSSCFSLHLQPGRKGHRLSPLSPDAIEGAIVERLEHGHADEARFGFAATVANASPPADEGFRQTLRASLEAEAAQTMEERRLRAIQHRGKEANPGNSEFPATSWEPNEVVRDQFAVLLPEELPVGRCELQVGIYDTASQRRYRPLGLDGAWHVVIQLFSIGPTGEVA